MDREIFVARARACGGRPGPGRTPGGPGGPKELPWGPKGTPRRDSPPRGALGPLGPQTPVSELRHSLQGHFFLQMLGVHCVLVFFLLFGYPKIAVLDSSLPVRCRVALQGQFVLQIHVFGRFVCNVWWIFGDPGPWAPPGPPRLPIIRPQGPIGYPYGPHGALWGPVMTQQVFPRSAG